MRGSAAVAKQGGKMKHASMGAGTGKKKSTDEKPEGAGGPYLRPDKTGEFAVCGLQMQWHDAIGEKFHFAGIFLKKKP